MVHKKKAEKIESSIYKKFGNAFEIMKKIKDKGSWFGVCPPCADYFGVAGSDSLTGWNWPVAIGS